jgi:hypothetical protein
LLHLQSSDNRKPAAINLIINQIIVIGCLDPGADVTCMDEHLAMRLGIKLEQKGLPGLLSAQLGHVIQPFATFATTCVIGSNHYDLRGFVVKNLICDLILGIDFLRETNAVMDFGEEFIALGYGSRENVPWLNSTSVLSGKHAPLTKEDINTDTSLDAEQIDKLLKVLNQSDTSLQVFRGKLGQARYKAHRIVTTDEIPVVTPKYHYNPEKREILNR